MRTAWTRAALAALALAATALGGDSKKGFKAVDEKDIGAHVAFLASPTLEGRDTPSEGLARAARYIAGRLADYGYLPPTPPAEGADTDAPGAVDEAAYLLPYNVERTAPVASACGLALRAPKQDERAFELGRDYVPVSGCDGDVEGELVFCGFGLQSRRERYDDYKGLKLTGKVAVIFSGEPRHAKRFEGADVTEAASLWIKLRTLTDKRVAGVLVVRREPVGAKEDPENLLDYRYTWADFTRVRDRRSAKEYAPTLEISLACATELLGRDARKLARSMDRTAKPQRLPLGGRSVRLRAETQRRTVPAHNVCGLLPGSDPERAGEYVVLGAHYDHIGVGPRGRVATGADDNAGGVAALLEVAEGLARARPARSILVVAFSGEEDGLLGSKAFCRRPPVPAESLAAMINLDMIGRGDAEEVVALGLQANPALEDVVKRAKRLNKTGLDSIVMNRGEELFRRADQHSFHRIGVPALFFFEGLPISRNKDYHTWRDTAALLDLEKVTRTARLVYNTAWILATDENRPPPPR